MKSIKKERKINYVDSKYINEAKKNVKSELINKVNIGGKDNGSNGSQVSSVGAIASVPQVSGVAMVKQQISNGYHKENIISNGAAVTGPLPADAKRFLTLELPSLIVVAGQTRTGKSNLVRLLITQACRNGQVNRVIVLCPTADMSKDYYYIKNKKYVKTDPTKMEEWIKQIYKEQVDLKKQGVSYKTLLILDDVMGHISFGDDIWKQIAGQSRHSELSIIMVLQNISSSIPPPVKENITTMFMTKMKANSLATAFKIQGHFSKQSEFEEYVRLNTVNYGCIRVDTGGLGSGLSSWTPPPLDKASQPMIEF